MSQRIRKGDLVAVISGNDRGKRGRVLRIIRENGRLVVEGVNLRFKHLRRSQQNPKGGRVRREMPIHASNVQPVDSETRRPTRVAISVADGRRVRVGRRSGKPLEGARGGGKE
jgi:large subunit ribosomal protein L24